MPRRDLVARRSPFQRWMRRLFGIAATIAVPVAVFVLAIWALALRPSLTTGWNVVVVVLALAVLASIAVPTVSLVATAVLVTATVVVLEVADRTG